MTENGAYAYDRYRSASSSLTKAMFDINMAKEYLRHYQRELSSLQVAVDKTNLTSSINYSED